MYMKNINLQLIEAASAGNRNAVLQALQDGACINAVDDEKTKLTALSAACKAGHKDIAELLLQQGAATDVCGYHESGGTPLIWAAANGDIPLAQLLLQHGADINFQDSFEWTPLHYACHRGQTDMGLFLLEQGANPYIKDDFDCTTLRRACYGNSTILVKRLLELGVDPFDEDIEGSNVLVSVEDAPLEIPEMLVREGLTPYSSFPWLYCTPILRATANNNMPLIRFWRELGGDIQDLTPCDSTLVGVACAEQNWELLPQLLEWGVDCILPDDDGFTPLMHLVACEDVFSADCAELLLRYGACINGEDIDDVSILDLAATPQAREWLLAHGCRGKLQSLDELEAAVFKRYGINDISDTQKLVDELYLRATRPLSLDFVRAVFNILWRRCGDEVKIVLNRTDAQGRNLIAMQCNAPGCSGKVISYLCYAWCLGESRKNLDAKGNSALWYALKQGNFAAAVELAYDTELLTIPGEDGTTPLQLLFGKPAPLVHEMIQRSYLAEVYKPIIKDGLSVLDRALLDAHAAGQRFLVKRFIEAGAHKEIIPCP